jgi:hypothetical protein
VADLHFSFPRLRGKAGMGDCRERFQDHVANAFDLFEDLIIPETQGPKPQLAQMGIALDIPGGVRMLASIHLDNQSSLDTDEIGDEGADRALAPEPVPSKLPMAQASPQHAFGVGHFPPQSTGEIQLLPFPHHALRFIEDA